MKNKNPLVSVIVPISNVEKYLHKCISSIIHQTYSNIEILCINDGSTDSSLNILETFSDPRIKIHSQNNQGLSSARNYGLSLAKGDFILFVDSDDFIELDCIESCISVCDDYELVLFCRNEIDAVTNVKKTIYYDFYRNLLIEFNKFELLEENVKPDCRIDHITWSKFYKRNVLENIKFPIGRLHEDLATTYRVYGNTNKAIMFNKPLYNYVLHSNSISNNKLSKNYIDAILGYEEQRQYYIANYPQFRKNASNLVIASINSYISNINKNDINEDSRKLIKEIKTLSPKYKLISILIKIKLLFV